MKARTDLVVVSFHGGGEGVDRQHVLPLGTTETFYNEPRGHLRAFTMPLSTRVRTWYWATAHTSYAA